MKSSAALALVTLLSVVAAQGCATPPEEETAASEDALATVVRAKVGPSRKVLLDTIGYNPRFDAIEAPWSSPKPDYAAALRESRASIIRYPGGTFGNYWDYDHDRYFPAASTHTATGWVSTAKTKPERVTDSIRNGELLTYGIEDLARVAAGPDAVNVVFQMNMVSPGQDFYESPEGWNQALHPHPGVAYDRAHPDDWYRMLADRYARFRRMLERAQANGVRVRFVELGNEYYFSHAYIEEAFPDGRAHGVAANVIADWIHRDFGDEVRVAATATCIPAGGPRMAGWNDGLAGVLDRSKVGWVTMHAYKAFQARNHYDAATFRGDLSDWIGATDRKFEDSGANRFFLNRDRAVSVWYTETNANWDGALDEGEGTPASEQKWAQSLVEAYSTVHLYDRGNASMVLQFHFNSLVRRSAVDGSVLYNRALAMQPFMRASKGATSLAMLDLHGPSMNEVPGTNRTMVQAMCFEGARKRCVVVNLAGHAARLDLRAALDAATVHRAGYASDRASAAAPRAVANDAPTADVRVPAYGVVSVEAR